MIQSSHWGISLSNNVHKKALVNSLLTKQSKGTLARFNDLDGMLFSDSAVTEFIKKEHRFQTIELTKFYNRPLITFSSGERKKIFLEYCIQQQPDYIIVDNPFDHLDQQSRLDLTRQLKELSSTLTLIQLSNREEDILPFIEHRGFIKDDSFRVIEFSNENKIIEPNSHFIDFPESLISFDIKCDSIVKFNAVSVSYNTKPIVKNIIWEIKKGEFWQLIGPNGSGKSTLLSLITGDNPKAYGQNLTIFGEKKGSGISVWDIKNKIGYFSTNMAELFNRNHTVEQMILSGFFDSIGLYRKPSNLQQQKVEQWLKIIKMQHIKNSNFNRLTLGQQRVVLLVRALIKQPPLLILDEPVEGLDQENTNLVIQLINTLIEKAEIAIVYVSHRAEAKLLSTNIYELTPSENGSTGHIKFKT